MKPRLRASIPTNPPKTLIQRQWRPQWTCTSCQQRQLRRHSSTPPTKPYYITSPIFYVNAAPHIGHMYTMLLTDVLKRWQVLKGRPALLCTGTDEHGLKIQQAALKAGIPPQEFCDGGADTFRDLARRIGMSDDDVFARTTDPRHQDAVRYAWQMLEDRGYIYERRHEGWYSVSDETFYPKSQVHIIVEPPTGRKIMASVETGKEVEWTSERNYHFRLSAFRDRLLELYEREPEFVVPRTRMEAVVKEVEAGLSDLSVSRPTERLKWGIRVPTDDSQTIYVWLDALLSYATAAGYPFTPGAESVGGWPADLHVVGKDIVRFHCIYWPAFLMALNLPLPKQVLTHAHWLLRSHKMAKSTGNVVNPLFALERFGLDALRYFLIHDGGIADDSNYDNRLVVQKYKKGLQGGIGNLAGRVMKGGFSVPNALKWFHGRDSGHLPETKISKTSKVASELYAELQRLSDQADELMRELLPNKALQTIMSATYAANRALQEVEPWNLRRDLEKRSQGKPTNPDLAAYDKQDLEDAIDRCIFLAAETLRISGILLQPFMPGSARRLLDMLNVDPQHRNWDQARIGVDRTYGNTAAYDSSNPLFPRLVCED